MTCESGTHFSSREQVHTENLLKRFASTSTQFDDSPNVHVTDRGYGPYDQSIPHLLINSV